MGQIVFPSVWHILGEWEYGGQWEVRMVDDYTGRTQAKNKSQTPLTSPGTSPLPSEALTLIRPTFVVSQASPSGCPSKIQQCFRQGNSNICSTISMVLGLLWLLTAAHTVGHFWSHLLGGLQEYSNHLRKVSKVSKTPHF